MSLLSVKEKYRQPEVVEFYRRFSTQGLQACEEEMLARYAPAPASVLDLGCGSGRAGLALEPRGYRVTGLDLTWEMLCAALGLYKQQRLDPRLVQADLRAIPSAAASYDVALVFIAALQHIPGQGARRQVFAEVARVLRPHGVLLLALDNLAPALTCYGYWGWGRLASIAGLRRSSPAAPSTRQEASPSTLPVQPTPADILLAARRTGTQRLAWHLRGMARTLRWRTWTGLIDVGRRMRLTGGQVGDTAIQQVSADSTPGLVYYHLYRHKELVADAATAGFELMGYHSGAELSEGQDFAPRARQLDKQVLYAFRRL